MHLCQQLDTLILNAGVMALPERKQTEDGYEYQFLSEGCAFVVPTLEAGFLFSAQQARTI